MEDARALFGNNYAMTLRNGLFLRNCGPAASPCLVSSELISERLYLASCGHKGDNISCFSNGTTAGYLSEEFVTKINCTSLFTTARYNRIAMSQPELVFGEAEIGWWMDGGECQCSANATCTRATTTVPEKMGYRCACVPGFLGDGFVAGEGCRKG
ncbi:putative Wall-associated receptor kinase-like 14 [Cocos nucifera]|uniref:Putative Wall-associated receptor kinase-like 14 n=1 Tax=Cocos nucifera TaxID=13894 RepID=A0A8K0ICS7_COCNU|nr:putative Wall-associated receptor kinase-like 14 [Cocos nucifera]